MSQNSPLRIGFSTLGCHDLDLVALRTLAAAHEMKFIELRGLGGTLDIPATLGAFPGGAAGARDFLREAGVYIVLIGTSFRLTTGGEVDRQQLLAEAEIGETLGARWLRVFGGGEWGDPFPSELQAHVRENRDWWKKIRAERNWKIDLILETHDAFSGCNELEALFAASGGPMPLLWDAHHTWKLAGEKPADSWARLGPFIEGVHLKDSVSQPDDICELPYTYVPTGEGEFPVAATLELLSDAGFQGAISLEWERKWHPQLVPLAEMLPKWAEVTAPFRFPREAVVLPEPVQIFGCDFSHATLLPSVGPYFHGPAEQYLDVHGATRHDAGETELGSFRIYFEGGDETQRSARIIADEANPAKKFLRFQIFEPNSVIQWPDGPQRKSRVQAELYGNRDLHEFYQKMRLRLAPSTAVLRDFPESFMWFTLVEMWNHAFWTDEAFPFRMGLGIGKPDDAPGSDLFFHVDGNWPIGGNQFEKLWHSVNRELPVPLDRWMTIELYYKEGAGKDGRLWVAVTPDDSERVVIADIHDSTCSRINPNPDGMKQLNPMKCYTSAATVDFMKARGEVLQLDWADLEIWQGKTPEDP